LGIGLFITLNFGLLKILMVKSLVLSGIFLKLFLSYTLLLSICTIVPIIVAVAFFTLAERKIMASIQRRRGPNIVGVGGLLQPFADGLKAVVKELVLPAKAGKFLFFLAPSIAFIFSLLNKYIFLIFSKEVSNALASVFISIFFASTYILSVNTKPVVSIKKFKFTMSKGVT
jgi:NADH:ubiquinone oxidoreductase subunit H